MPASATLRSFYHLPYVHSLLSYGEAACNTCDKNHARLYHAIAGFKESGLLKVNVFEAKALSAPLREEQALLID